MRIKATACCHQMCGIPGGVLQAGFGVHHSGPEMRSKVGRGAFDTHCAYPTRWGHILVQVSVPFCGSPFRSARRTVLARTVRPHSTPDQHAIAYIQPMFVYRVCLRRKEHIQPLPCIPIPHEHPRSSYLAAQRVFMMAPTAHSYLVRLLMEVPQQTCRRPSVVFVHNEHTHTANTMSRHALIDMYKQHECHVLRVPNVQGHSLPGTHVY